MPRQSRKRRQASARYNSSREPMVVPHGLSVRLGGHANQEHLLVLAVQTLSGEARQEKSHHRGGTYPHRHWLSLAEKPEQLRGSWRKLLRSHPLRRSQAVLGEAAPTTRAQGNSRADGSCLTHRFPQLFSREKAGLRRDAVRSQVIDVLESTDQRRPAMKKTSSAVAKQGRNISRQTLTIGLDLGDRNSWYCVLDEAGRIQLEQRVRTTAKALQEVFGTMPRSRVALEIGTHSPWISRLLKQLGHEVIVANARKVRLIGESRKKDDRLDAQTLARLARIDPG